MFIYWDNFEIDGSDTNFNLILPERELLSEIIEYYLSLPIWNRKKGIGLDEKSITSHRFGYGNEIMTFEGSNKIDQAFLHQQQPVQFFVPDRFLELLFNDACLLVDLLQVFQIYLG